MARVWGAWHGGINYMPPGPDDVECFASLAEAKRVLWDRSDGDPFYPCVEDSIMYVWSYDPRPFGFDPERVMSFGPRGGIRVEVC